MYIHGHIFKKYSLLLNQKSSGSMIFSDNTMFPTVIHYTVPYPASSPLSRVLLRTPWYITLIHSEGDLGSCPREEGCVSTGGCE